MVDSAGDEVGYAQLDAMGGFETETLGNLKTKLFTQIDPVTDLYYGDGNTFYDPALGLYLQPHPNNGPEPTGGFSPLSGGVPRLVDGSPGSPSLGFVSGAIGFGKSALHDYGSANNLWFYGKVTQKAYIAKVSYKAQVSVEASQSAITRLERRLSETFSDLTLITGPTSKRIGSRTLWRLSFEAEYWDAPLLKAYVMAVQGDILPASSNRTWRAKIGIDEITTSEFNGAVRGARFTRGELIAGAFVTDFILEAGFQLYDDLSDPYWSPAARVVRTVGAGAGGAFFGSGAALGAEVGCAAAGVTGIGLVACAIGGGVFGSYVIWGKAVKPFFFDGYLRNNRLKLSPL